MQKYRQEGRARQGAAIALAAILVAAVGCVATDSPRALSENFTWTVRPSAAETARLQHNAAYFLQLGRPQVALRELEEAYQRNPADLQLANTLAETYDKLGQHRRALEIYQGALARSPDNRTLSNNSCFSHYLAGEWPQAEACFRETLARQPDNEAARNNLGLVLCRLGRVEEARRLWQEAEGEAAAAQKLDQVLAALGLASLAPVARATSPGGSPAGAPPGGPRSPVAAVQPERPAAPQLSRSPEKPNPERPQPIIPANFVSAARTQAPAPEARKEAESPGEKQLTARRQIAKAGPLGMKAAPTAAAPAPSRVEPAALLAGTSPALGSVPPPKSPGSGSRVVTAAPPPPPAVAVRPGPLTARELLDTRIEVRNGNGSHDLARETRSVLTLEGFNVVSIANHLDFGMEQTTIYYRPGTEKMALALQQKFFGNALVQPAPQLAAYLDIKVILGRDLSSPFWAASQAGPTDRS